MKKAFKFKLLPNDEQKELINKTLGCCRYVYNNALDHKQKAYKRRKQSLSANDLKNLLPHLKKAKPWLAEVDSIALQQSIMRMCDAYTNFFKGRAGYPRFKRKHDAVASYKTMGTPLYVVNDKYLNIPKLGNVRCKFHRQPQGIIKSATISRQAGNYYISLLCEADDEEHYPITAKTIGIDLGIKEFAVDSNGKTYANPKYLTKSLQKLKREQQKLSKLTKGSRNYNKQKLKLAKLHLHISNQRKDYAHKLSSTLIRENQIICVEDLDIRGMLKKEDPSHKTRNEKDNNKARAILDVGWGQFVNFLEYKAAWKGRKLIKIDRYIPSSQMCNNCKQINPLVKDLSIRQWVCPKCHTVHDRDYNAAINILNEGLKMAAKSP